MTNLCACARSETDGTTELGHRTAGRNTRTKPLLWAKLHCLQNRLSQSFCCAAMFVRLELQCAPRSRNTTGPLSESRQCCVRRHYSRHQVTVVEDGRRGREEEDRARQGAGVGGRDSTADMGGIKRAGEALTSPHMSVVVLPPSRSSSSPSAIQPLPLYPP